MQTEEAEKIKNGKVKRLLKRIVIGLFILLIIALCIFQAPWKVLALFIIILASFTVLPKPARKWFWFSVVSVVIALIIWVFLPDDNEGWRPYTFDEEIAALEAKRAVPDSENAAVIYNKLLETYDSNTISPDFLDNEAFELTMSNFWSDSDYPELARWLKKQQPILEGLEQASTKADCRFPVVANTSQLEDSMDRSSLMRRWAYLLIWAGNNDIGEGRVEEGLENYVCMLQMGEHLRQQITILNLLVGIAVESLAINQFNRFVVTGDVTEGYLNFIERTLAKIKYDWNREMLEIIECEKFLLKNMLSLFYEMNPEGKTRFNRSPLVALKAQMPGNIVKQIPPQNYWQKKYTKIGIILAWFGMPSTPQKAGDIIDASYANLYEKMIKPEFKWEEPTTMLRWIKLNYRGMVKLLTSITEPAYYKVHKLYQRAIVTQRTAQLIVALRRYKNQNGHWPQSLDDIQLFVQAKDLVDPLNNSSFVYKLTDENFTLYSKGRNNIDDEGKRDHWDEEKAGMDDLLIWPFEIRETNKEDPNDK